MHVPTFAQGMALFYSYLVNFALAEPLIHHATRRTLFRPDTAKIDFDGNLIANDIAKSTEPYLKVQ